MSQGFIDSRIYKAYTFQVQITIGFHTVLNTRAWQGQQIRGLIQWKDCHNHIGYKGIKHSHCFHFHCSIMGFKSFDFYKNTVLFYFFNNKYTQVNILSWLLSHCSSQHVIIAHTTHKPEKTYIYTFIVCNSECMCRSLYRIDIGNIYIQMSQ